MKKYLIFSLVFILFIVSLGTYSKGVEAITINFDFGNISPRTEIYLASEEYMVRGYLDALFETDSGLHIVDYKTSKRDHCPTVP